MAEAQTYYDSTLTGEELDTAMKKLPQVDQAVEQAARSALLAQSWAEGGTDLRTDEEIHNARYWCSQAQTAANGCLGWYADEEQLESLYPAGQNGQWAIVGATNTIWVWDGEGEVWVDTGEKVDLSDYYTKEQTKAVTPFLYKATFLLDNWAGEGPYTQTAVLTPVDGGPAVEADGISVTAGIDNSLPEETKGLLRVAAWLINKAQRTLGEGTLSVSTADKPVVDAEVFFWVRKGGE